jgi:hypothetical protein
MFFSGSCPYTLFVISLQTCLASLGTFIATLISARALHIFVPDFAVNLIGDGNSGLLRCDSPLGMWLLIF